MEPRGCPRPQAGGDRLPCRYAEVVVASENSVHKLLELLPGKILNGEKVEVRLATRQNLSQFEAQARKREWRRRGGHGGVSTLPVGTPRSSAELGETSGFSGGAGGAFAGCFPFAAESDFFRS